MIDLPRAPRLLYLIGLAGTGKSYIGSLIGRLAGYHVYDADDDLSPEMRRAIEENMPWTEEQRDWFYALVCSRIIDLARVHSRLLVTQATYKQRHRDMIAEKIPGIEFIWVVASPDIAIRRLRERNNFVTVDYFLKIKESFEPPPLKTKILVNNGSEVEVIQQLITYFGQESPPAETGAT